MPKAWSVEDIKAAGYCSGCGLCQALNEPGENAIEMRDSEAGYRRPFAIGAVGAAQKEKIDALCPGLNINHEATSQSDYNPRWGAMRSTYLGWASDDALRKHASSGGGLSSVLKYLIESERVAGVVQTSVSDESPLRNMVRISRNPSDIFESAGSRYAPSSPLQDIDRVLQMDGVYAFVGKPCDVAGLRAYARVNPAVSEKFPYMLAFMCAGVPGYKGTDAVLDALGIEDKSKVESFRYRGDGWPGFATAKLPGQDIRKMDYNRSWGSILNRHLQFRCKICPDGTGEFADISFADGWLCDDNGYPLFEETEGRSLILTRTEKGDALLRDAVDAGTIQIEALEASKLSNMQPFQSRRKGLTATRLAAIATTLKPLPRYRNTRLLAALRFLRPVEMLKSYLGTLKRIFRRNSHQ